MAAYKLLTAGGVLRTADGALIPADQKNADWRAYLAWADDGNVPDPADPELPGRIIASRLRLKLTLIERGKLAAVESAVAQAGALAGLYWAEAADFESDHPLVAQIGAAIGLDADGIRELFAAARDRAA